jgi:hypothetical protein
MWKMNEEERKFNIKSIYWYLRCKMLWNGKERKGKRGQGENY